MTNNYSVMHLLIVLSVSTLVTTLEAKLNTTSGESQNRSKIPSWDSNGYVFFCLCMGRFGYQTEYFLGGLAFAKGINRTLVLPPFRSKHTIYVPFTDWIKTEPLEKYHRVITAEDFMTHLAPNHWPVGSRKGFCYQYSDSLPNCTVKDSELFTDFWDGQGVDFDENVPHKLGFSPGQYAKWNKLYPASDHPVLAMRAAPAEYPMREEHKHLQKYIVFNDHIEEQAQNYIDQHFKDEKFVGIHIRNGKDWVIACNQLAGSSLPGFAPVCTNEAQCLPSMEWVFMKTRLAIRKVNATAVFVASDTKPNIKEMQRLLGGYGVKVYHMDPLLAQVDLAILNKSTWFIGNCVSAFTRYVKRHRDGMNKDTSFF